MFSVPKPPSPAASNGEHVPASPNISSSSHSSPADNRPASVSPVPPSAYHFPAPRDTAPSRSSRHSEGYPSWLPRRPPPPAPASTIGTSTPAPFDHPEYFPSNDEDIDLDAELRHLDTQYVAAHDEDENESPVAPNPLLLGSGRKPTPRSVRIVNLETSITEEPRTEPEGPRPTFATSYGHWKTRAKQRQNRVSAGSAGVAHPSSAVVAGGVPRGWTRGTAPPTMFNSVASNLYPQDSQVESRPRPRFNTRGLHLELLRSPSIWMKVYYRLWPILNLAHLPLQTFLDFNAVYMLIQVSQHPLPNASPSSSKNWALGAAAYLASWLTWILIVFVVYELVYSFIRRWRVRRPLIFQIYISNPAYTYACMSSFNTFCFFQHLRWTAFVPIAPELDGITSSSSSSSHDDVPAPQTSEERHHGRNDSTSSDGSANETSPALGARRDPNDHPVDFKHHSRSPLPFHSAFRKRMKKAQRTWSQITWKDGLAETFNLYAQNVPTIVTLLPRAGLALALVLGFAPGIVDGAADGVFRSNRDSTFFRPRDGLLTGYAQGVLWANVAWTAWRLLVLWVSWVGLWILSGHACAGICGPRDKWEEEELSRLSASLARARRVPYPGSSSGNPADDTKEGADVNAAIGLGAGRNFIRQQQRYGHRRFASSWSNNSNGSSVDADDDILPWEWRECTRARVQDAWEFCVVGDGGRLRWGSVAGAPVGMGGVPPTQVTEKRPKTPPNEKGRKGDGTGLDEEGLQRVLAAVGFGSPNVPTPARRGALRSDLFQSPDKRSSGSSLERGSPSGGPAAMLTPEEQDPRDEEEREQEMGERRSLPPLQYPYPFAKPGSGYVSSKEEGLVPFPQGEAHGSKGSKNASKSGSKSPLSSDHDVAAHPVHGQQEEEADSSSHAYSSEPSTTTSSSSSMHNPRATGSQSNSLSSLGQPIPPTSPAFVSTGMRPLTLSGGTGYSHVAPSHRHSSLGSVMTSTSGGVDPNTSITSGTLGGTSSNAAEISPTSTRTGNTRFPFLSGPPSSASNSNANSPVSVQHVSGMGIGIMGPSLHYGVHGRRVVVQHTGGNQSSMNTSTSGSAHGHGSGEATGRGRGHRRGLSHTSGFSSALGSDLGYAASGSGEGDVDEDMDEYPEEEGGVVVDEFGRVRGRASLSTSSGESQQSGVSGGEGVGAGAIPMPRRHPHAGRTRTGAVSAAQSASSLSPSASASRNVSKSSGESRAAAGRVAFPTSDVDTAPAESGMTGYGRGMGMEMLSIEASDSLARRERAGRRGAAAAPWARDKDDVAEEERQPGHAQEQTEATVRPRRAENDDDDMYVDDEDVLGELDEEAREEREDRVGLLTSSLGASAASLHHGNSPRSSAVGVDQLGQLMPGESRRSGSRSRKNSTPRRSRESLSAAVVAAATRSRHSSNVRSNRSSLAGSASASPTIMPASPGGTRRNSLFGSAAAAVRDRASSFGGRVRERAQSLMQSVVGTPTRERTTSEVGGHAARHRRLGSGDATSILDAVPPLPTQPQSPLSPPALGRSVSEQSQESTGSSELSGIVPIQGVHRDYGQLQPQHPIAEDDAYASSHSRSGSESVSTGENHTFGRPMPFMQPRQRASGDLPEAPEREEEEQEEQSASAPRLRTTSITPSVSSTGDDIFYSPISATPLQSGLTTPVPPGHVPSAFTFQQQPPSAGQQGPDAPWQQRIRQAPERQWSGRGQPVGPSGSADMLSTAAQSFVTAPHDAQSLFTTTTTTGGDSSEAATLSGSFDARRGSGFVGAFLSGTAAARGTGRGRRESGFVERAEGSSFVPGSGGGLGDGRVA